MDKKTILTWSLRDAIDWQEGFLDTMRGCDSPSDLETIRRSENLLSAYRKTLARMTKNYAPYPPVPEGKPISIYEIAEESRKWTRSSLEIRG